MQDLKELLKNPTLRILPGELAFFLVLSIIPIITLIGYIASFFSISIDALIQFMKEVLPLEINDILLPLISGTGFDINIFVFMVLGYLFASNGPHSIIVASNLLYEIPSKNYLKSRIKAFFMTILLVLLFFLSLLVLGFGNTILHFLFDLRIFQFFTKEVFFFLALIKWPIAFLFIFLMIKFIYTVAPDEKIPSRSMNQGALLTTVSFLLVTALYSYYVSNFAHYDLFYGSLSNMIIFMMWIYILSYVMVVGIAMNANNYKRLEEQKLHKEKKAVHTND